MYPKSLSSIRLYEIKKVKNQTQEIIKKSSAFQRKHSINVLQKNTKNTNVGVMYFQHILKNTGGL